MPAAISFSTASSISSSSAPTDRHARRRRLQQDRHLSEGARRCRQSRAVLRGHADFDHRLGHARRREGNSHRAAQRARSRISSASVKMERSRRSRSRQTDRPRRTATRSTSPGATRHGARHRARNLRGERTGAPFALSRAIERLMLATRRALRRLRASGATGRVVKGRQMSEPHN